MIFDYQRKLPSFNTVAAGSVSSVNIPVGPTYYAIVLKYGTGTANGADETNTKAEVNKIRLNVNGVTRWECSGKHAIDTAKFYGIPFNTGEIVIPLSRPWLKTIEAQENTAWGTGNVDTLSLEVEIDSGATSPTLEAHAFVTPDKRDLGTIIEVHEFDFSTAVSGDFEIASLPKGNGDFVAAHFENANIDKLDLKVNQVAFVDGDLAILQNGYEWVGERSKQTGYEHLDALFRNQLSRTYPLKNVEDFRVVLNLSSSGSVPIVMETLNTPNLA